MCNKSAISLFILYLSLHLAHFKEISVQNANDWDILIFTQHWPPTVCKDWIHNKPNHACTFPKQNNSWTIHGIWPTKIGSRGPEKCNSTWLFDPEQVRPIEDELEQYWTNIEKGTPLYDFWAHEWNKHGTCAAAIEPLNNEFKYFNKGLQLLTQLSMTDILGKSSIWPADNKSITVDELNQAIVTATGKKPMIMCRFEDHIQYIFELRLCLDKQLYLIDCPGKTSRFETANTVTNCQVNKPIVYPVQPTPKAFNNTQYNTSIVKYYELINWIQWFTL